MQRLERDERIIFGNRYTALGLYRPFCRKWAYYQPELFENSYQIPKLFPLGLGAGENLVISMNGLGAGKAYSCLISDILPDYQLQCNGQCFPLYYYERLAGSSQLELEGMDNGSGCSLPGYLRRDALTDETLEVFRRVYPRAFAEQTAQIEKRREQKRALLQVDCGRYSRSYDAGPELTKEDIFFYIYALLHSPEYRERFANNLLKELPRIPLARDFVQFSLIGRKLAQVHLEYESGPMYELEERYISDEPSLRSDPGRVTKMRWGKGNKNNGKTEEDRSTLVYNENLVLTGIPERAHDYVVNGRSALDWIVYMYQLKTDKDSGIVSDPNAYSENPRYLVDLIKRVTYVAVETVKLVESLPKLDEIAPEAGLMPEEWLKKF